MVERITEAAARLQGWLAGTFAYTAYRGRAPDGVPQLRSDVGIVVKAALSAEGMVLVPREPTPEMLTAMADHPYWPMSRTGAREHYRAMLAAAPTSEGSHHG